MKLICSVQKVNCYVWKGVVGQRKDAVEKKKKKGMFEKKEDFDPVI